MFVTVVPCCIRCHDGRREVSWHLSWGAKLKARFCSRLFRGPVVFSLFCLCVLKVFLCVTKQSLDLPVVCAHDAATNVGSCKFREQLNPSEDLVCRVFVVGGVRVITWA